MKKILIILGVLTVLSPIVLTGIGLAVCLVHSTNICLAVPFAWMLLWPAYVAGAAMLAVAALISSKAEKATSTRATPRYMAGVFLVLVVVSAFAVLSRSSRIDEERKQVVVFAKNNEKVIASAGEQARANLQLERQTRFGNPYRYIVSVNGSSRLSAVVDVSRSWTESTFSLACITSVEPGNRDPFKDECAQ